MIEVNLLPGRMVLSSREQSIRRVLVSIVGVISLILVIDLLVFFLFQQLFSRQVADLKTARSGLSAQAQQYATITSALQTVEEKTAGIVVVQSFRKDMAAVISEVVKILVPGVEMGNLSVDATGKVAFDAKATSLESLGQFIDKINSPTSGSHLTKVTLGGLRQDGGNYQFQVSTQYANF